MASRKPPKSFRFKLFALVRRKKKRKSNSSYDFVKLDDDSLPVLESIDESEEFELKNDNYNPASKEEDSISGELKDIVETTLPEVENANSDNLFGEINLYAYQNQKHDATPDVKQSTEILDAARIETDFPMARASNSKHTEVLQHHFIHSTNSGASNNIPALTNIESENANSVITNQFSTESSSCKNGPNPQTEDETFLLQLPGEDREIGFNVAVSSSALLQDTESSSANVSDSSSTSTGCTPTESLSKKDESETASTRTISHGPLKVKPRIVRFAGMPSQSESNESKGDDSVTFKTSGFLTHDHIQQTKFCGNKPGSNVFEIARQSSLFSEGEVDIILVDEVEAVNISRQTSKSEESSGVVSDHSDTSDDVFADYQNDPLIDITAPVFPLIRKKHFQGVLKTDFIFQEPSDLQFSKRDKQFMLNTENFKNVAPTNCLYHNSASTKTISQSSEETTVEHEPKPDSSDSLSACTLRSGSESDRCNSASNFTDKKRESFEVSEAKTLVDPLFILSSYLKRFWENDSELESIIKVLYKWGHYNVVVDGVLNTFYPEDHIYFYLSEYKSQTHFNPKNNALPSVCFEDSNIGKSKAPGAKENTNSRSSSQGDDCPVLEQLFSYYLDQYLLDNIRNFTEKTLYCRFCSCIHIIEVI